MVKNFKWLCRCDPAGLTTPAIGLGGAFLVPAAAAAAFVSLFAAAKFMLLLLLSFFFFADDLVLLMLFPGVGDCEANEEKSIVDDVALPPVEDFLALPAGFRGVGETVALPLPPPPPPPPTWVTVNVVFFFFNAFGFFSSS